MDPQVGLTPIEIALTLTSVSDQPWLLTIGLALSFLLLLAWLSVRIQSEAGVWGVATLGTAAGIAALSAAKALSIGTISSEVVGDFGYSAIWLVLGLASVIIRDVERPTSGRYGRPEPNFVAMTNN
jgi:hypothetical protein